MKILFIFFFFGGGGGGGRGWGWMLGGVRWRGSTQLQCIHYLVLQTDLGSRGYFGVERRSSFPKIALVKISIQQ